MAIEDQSAQHRDRANSPGKGATGNLRHADEDGRNQRRLGDGKPGESEERVQGIGAKLEQPVHVHPGPAGCAQGEWIETQECPLMQDLAPGSQVPVDVSVGDRAQRNHEGPHRHG